jgi:hypothetical protein
VTDGSVVDLRWPPRPDRRTGYDTATLLVVGRQPSGRAAVDPRPNRIQVWLGGGVVDLLQALGSGEVALTHEALHAWHSPQAVPHLRHQLIACGLLPAIDPHLAYFETWLHHRLAALADHPHHQLLRRFALWHQLPRLRADAAARPLRATARQYAMGQFFAGTALLTWLDEHRIEPRHLTQAPLDQWCLTIPLYSRHRIRGFLLWATQHGHVPPGLDLPNLTFQPGTGMTQQQRIELLRRYVNDETHDDTDDGAAPLHARTAACLLLLYAQPLSRILRLTHDDVVDIDGVKRPGCGGGSEATGRWSSCRHRGSSATR